MDRFKNSLELIKKFKIGYVPEGYDNLYKAAIKAAFKPEILIKAGLVVNKDGKFRDFFVFRPLIIPVHSAKGTICGFVARQMPWSNARNKDGKEYPKYINTSDTAIYKKGKILFGLDPETQAAIRKEDKVYLVEGNTDKTSMFHIGVKNVLTKSGTALTDDQIETIKRFTKNVCLIGDNDNAGKLSDYRSGEKLIMQECNVTYAELPEKQDPDSYFTSNEIFTAYIKEHELDYIIDWRAIDEYNNANTVQLKKKVKEAVARLLLAKTKDDREEYIKAIVKETETVKSDWYDAIKAASFKQRDKGLNITEDQDSEPIECDQSSENRERHDFYIVKKDKSKKYTGIDIDERKLLLKLKSTRVWEMEQKKIYFGFFTYSLSEDESEMIFVQLREGRIKKVSINFIKRTFVQYIRQLKPYKYEWYSNDGLPCEASITSKDIELLIYKKVTTLFEEKRLILFPDKKIELLSDTLDKHYTFFKNCYVVSTKDGYITNDYENLKEGYVWDDAVLDRNFTEPKTKSPGIFEKFVHDISGNCWDTNENKSLYPETERYNSMLISGGYLLHNFTDMERKAVVYTQGRLSEDDTAEGREGKTIFVEALGRYLLNKLPDESRTYIYIPGKDLKTDDKHKWQDIELNTTLVLYDDPPPQIRFEDLYNVAERAFKQEKKNQSNNYVKARIAITTNRPLERDSGSSKARSCVIELDSIFSEKYTPTDKYGHWFFRDWKAEREDEWNKFFKYVLGKMLPAYFQNNCKLLEPPSKNLYRNELLQKARRLTKGVDIIFWLDYLVKGDKENEPFFHISGTYSTKDMYPSFLTYSGYKDDQRLKTNFAKVIKAYFEKEGISFEADRDSRGTILKILGGAKISTAVETTQQETNTPIEPVQMSLMGDSGEMPF